MAGVTPKDESALTHWVKDHQGGQAEPPYQTKSETPAAVT